MAYACYGSEYYKDDEVLRKIIHSLDYTTTNYYSTEGRARWEATGQITGINDWSHWDLHIPTRLIDTLICIEDKLTKNQIDTYLKYFYTRFAAPFDNGMNYIHTGKSILGSAFLRNDYERAISVLNDMVRTYLFVDDNERIVSNKIVEREGQTVNKKGSGFFSDGSYVFHTFHSMNGTYGLGHFEAAAELESVLKNTRFEINSAAKFNMISFFLDGLDPLFLGTAMYRHVLGRYTNPSHYTTGISALADAFSIAPVYGKEVEDEFYKIIKTAYVTSPYKSDFISKLNINEVKRFKEMILDDSIPVIQDHSINKVYYNMDKVVHERNDWGFGISMMSSRMFGYECINNENMTGWYLGDGRTEWLLRDSDINSTSTYWSSMDPYRLPGTTVDTQERKAVSIYNGNEFLSSKDFVGGVTIDGKYGAAAMDAESYHYDEDFGVDGGQHGGKAPAHKNDLVAKKSYFMLDDAVVCLGTAINAKDNNNSEVLTIVDNVMATQTQTLSGLMSISAPYKIESAVASENPEPENSDINTIDSNYATKWAGNYGEIVWDIGSPQTLGFINLSFQNGDKRKQNFELLISEDNVKWESIFSGMSSGTTDDDEAFDLGSKTGRYVKFINKGNSTGSGWVSLTECSIYPPNMDGTIGLMDIDIAGIDPVYSNNGELSIGIEDSSLQGISWINFDNKCGYWFPSRPANENIGALKARWTNDISSHFELWFSHGINPTDAGYAYAILPGASKEETKAFAESGNVQILSNNNSVQAVRDLNTNLTYIVFWKSGSFEGIRVSAPCMVIAKETDTTFELALSDPSQKLSQLTLTLNKALKVTKADDFATVTSNDSATEIKYDLTVSPGRTLECKFTK